MQLISDAQRKDRGMACANRNTSEERPVRVIRGYRLNTSARGRAQTRAHTAIVILLVSGFLGGCQSAPMRAWQGAQHFSAGDAALEREDPQEAIRELTLAATLVPHASEIQNHLGLAYWKAGDELAAVRAFEAALEIDCDNQPARVNLDRLLEVSALVPPPRPEQVGDKIDGR